MLRRKIFVGVALLSLAFIGSAGCSAIDDAQKAEKYKKDLSNIPVPDLPKRFDELYSKSQNAELKPAESAELTKIATATADKVDDFVLEVEKLKAPPSMQAAQRDLILQWSRKAERMRDVAATGR